MKKNEAFRYLEWEFRFEVGRTYAFAVAGRAEILKAETLVCVIATSKLFLDESSMIEAMKARCVRWVGNQAR